MKRGRLLHCQPGFHPHEKKSNQWFGHRRDGRHPGVRFAVGPFVPRHRWGTGQFGHGGGGGARQPAAGAAAPEGATAGKKEEPKKEEAKKEAAPKKEGKK